MASLLCLPLFLAALTLVGCAIHSPGCVVPRPAGEWLYCEEVVYRENHDPSMIWLADGREIQVVYGTTGGLSQPSFKAVETWPAGRPLCLAFGPGCGVILFDPETSGRLPVIGGLDGCHPLDQLLEQHLNSAVTTIAITDAYGDNARLWETEIERLYAVLRNGARVSPETRELLARAHLAWGRFSEAQFAAAARLFQLPSGTKWRNECADYYRKIVRAQALSLLSLIEPMTTPELEDSLDPELK